MARDRSISMGVRRFIGQCVGLSCSASEEGFSMIRKCRAHSCRLLSCSFTGRRATRTALTAYRRVGSRSVHLQHRNASNKQRYLR